MVKKIESINKEENNMLGDLYRFIKSIILLIWKLIRFLCCGMWICLWATIFLSKYDSRRWQYINRWKFNYRRY